MIAKRDSSNNYRLFYSRIVATQYPNPHDELYHDNRYSAHAICIVIIYANEQFVYIWVIAAMASDIAAGHSIPEGDMIDATSKLQLEAAEVPNIR